MHQGNLNILFSLCFGLFIAISLLACTGLGEAIIDDSADEPTNDFNPGAYLMDMKVAEAIRLLQLDPGILARAVGDGEKSVLEKFRDYVQGKLLDIVSVSCYADLAYFAQQLLEYGASVHQLSSSCAEPNSTTGDIDCACGKMVADAATSKSWTMSVLDSTGRVLPGVFQGNLMASGDFRQCVDLVHVKNTRGETWQGRYCRIDTRFYQNQTCSTTYVLRQDTCFPSSCSQHDVQALVNSTLEHISAKGGAGPASVICQVKAICHEKEMTIANDPPAILVLSIIILVLALMAIGTLYDYYSYQPILQTLSKTPSANTDSGNANGLVSNSLTQAQYFQSQSRIVKMFLAFSVYSNGLKLFDTTKRPGQIHCLHGVRFLSMAWIIFGHTYYWSRNYLNNLLQAYTLPPKFLNQVLLNGSLSVDAFYTISAMLLVYLWMKEMKKTEGRLLKSPRFWFMFYFHRYIRITPLYAIVLAIDATLIKYAADGPLWNQEGVEGTACQKSWWTNLIYINNFVYLDDQCMSWSWYLANDMQFYVVSPIFLLLLWWKEMVGVAVIVLTIIATGILRGAIILSNPNWPPISIFSTDEKQFELVEPYWKAVYIKPYCRCGPFLVGLLLGYIFYKTQLKWAAHLGWLLAAGLGVGIVFGLYEFSNGATISAVGTAIYGGFGRTLWAIALSYVIFASSTGYGGPIAAFLSWKLFIPLSKLVFAAYLLHPILIMVYYSSQKKPMHFSGHYHYVSYFLVHIILSFSIALLLSMAFEMPIQGLENMLSGSKKKRKTSELKPGTNDQSHHSEKATAT